MNNMQAIFTIAVVIFTAGNLGAMGLAPNVREATKALRNSPAPEEKVNENLSAVCFP